MEGKKQDLRKKYFWQRTIREAIRSKLSIREFCRQHRLKESQFYWWQRRLNGSRRPKGQQRGSKGEYASFALVSNDPGTGDAGIELILQDGSRLRISRGVDEQTLRDVLAAVGSARC
jgi:transposase-like protein